MIVKITDQMYLLILSKCKNQMKNKERVIIQ